MLERLKYGNLLGLRRVVNALYHDPDHVVLDRRRFEYVVSEGNRYGLTDQLKAVEHVNGNPWFQNVRPEDVVLDIGANIGAIAIPLARHATKVFALEPLFAKELRENIKLNELKNVQVLEYGIGPQFGRQRLSFSSREAFCEMVTLAQVFDITGPVDYLKVDCEGAEWDFIEPEDCEGIREIRMEFHVRRGHRTDDEAAIDYWRAWMDGHGYAIIEEHGIPLSPVTGFHFCYSLNASKGEATS